MAALSCQLLSYLLRDGIHHCAVEVAKEKPHQKLLFTSTLRSRVGVVKQERAKYNTHSNCSRENKLGKQLSSSERDRLYGNAIKSGFERISLPWRKTIKGGIYKQLSLTQS